MWECEGREVMREMIVWVVWVLTPWCSDGSFNSSCLYRILRCVHWQCCSTVPGLWSCRLGSEPGIGSRDSDPLLWLLPSPLFRPRPRSCPLLARLPSTHAAGTPQSLGHCCTPTLEEAAGQNGVGGGIKTIRGRILASFF